MVSPVNSSSNAEPCYPKKPQNEDLINSISALINTRLPEFRSEMMTLINKNGDQTISLGHRDSYYKDFETNNSPKQKKARQEITTLMTCLRYIKIMHKIIIMEQ